jgi:hypothetical protein
MQALPIGEKVQLKYKVITSINNSISFRCLCVIDFDDSVQYDRKVRHEACGSCAANHRTELTLRNLAHNINPLMGHRSDNHTKHCLKSHQPR